MPMDTEDPWALTELAKAAAGGWGWGGGLGGIPHLGIFASRCLGLGRGHCGLARV